MNRSLGLSCGMIESENEEAGRSLQLENENKSSLAWFLSFYLDFTEELLQNFSQRTDMNNFVF